MPKNKSRCRALVSNVTTTSSQLGRGEPINNPSRPKRLRQQTTAGPRRKRVQLLGPQHNSPTPRATRNAPIPRQGGKRLTNFGPGGSRELSGSGKKQRLAQQRSVRTYRWEHERLQVFSGGRERLNEIRLGIPTGPNLARARAKRAHPATCWGPSVHFWATVRHEPYSGPRASYAREP